MQISALVIGSLLFVTAIAYVSLPFRQKLKAANRSKTQTQEKGKRETVLSALRDLEFDFKIGKVSEEDYKPLRAQLMVEVAQYMEAEKEEEERLEALIQSRRKAQRQNAACEHCGAPLEAGQRFCSKCGSAAQDELCPSCGKKIRAGDLFCSSCGTNLRIQVKAAA